MTQVSCVTHLAQLSNSNGKLMVWLSYLYFRCHSCHL